MLFRSITISNCYVTGSITATNNSLYVGGLVGLSSSYDASGFLNISDCYNSASVTSKGTSISLLDLELGMGLPSIMTLAKHA